MLWIAGSLGVFPDGKTYALVFGAWFGFAELIPYVGPAIGAAPPVLVALFSDNPVDALWLAIMFTVLQQIEGHIVAPTVFSQALRINPLLVIFALLMGGRLYGFAGAFLALPLAAVRARERRLLPRAPGARAVGDADRRRAGRAPRRPPPPAPGRAAALHRSAARPPTRRVPRVRDAASRRGVLHARAARSSRARTRRPPRPPPRRRR